MTPAGTMRPEFDRVQKRALVVGIIGILALLAVFAITRDVGHFFQSYLFAFIFWNGLTIGCLGLYLLHNVVGGNWGVVIRRFLEAGTRTLPITLILFIPVLIGVHQIYPWAQPGSHMKAAYLNVPFFTGRAAFYFALWMFWGFRLLKLSGEQDRTGDPGQAIQLRMKAFAPLGLLLFVVTTSFAFIDWVMSLEPDWFSTIYGWLFTVGQTLQTFAFCIILLIILAPKKPFLGLVKIQHFHDLSNLMLAFTMLWAYMSLSQFLIIWAENLPEEIPWYVRRFSGGWGVIAVMVALFHFALPFFLLLMRFIKRNPKYLYWVACWMFAVRILADFWMIEPAFRRKGLEVFWTDPLAFVGIGGIWIAAFAWRLKERPLLPLHDPRLGYHPVETEV
ncbi:MAG: hypothetical protein M3O35_06865 [Acidobacteriota bacterium]|nr:hypothetical protein [Acidobacteriota bacterium]